MGEVIVVTSGKGGVGKTILPQYRDRAGAAGNKVVLVVRT
jgi:septum formation inhibitor-activating ATPase MinD